VSVSEALPRTEFDLYRGGTDRRLDRLEDRLDHLDDALEDALRDVAKQREGDLKAGTDALAKAIADYDKRRKEELQSQQTTRDRSWQRTFGIAATLGALVAAWYEILSHIR
jgi:hypothetical protein